MIELLHTAAGRFGGRELALTKAREAGMARDDARWLILGLVAMTVAWPTVCFAKWGARNEAASPATTPAPAPAPAPTPAPAAASTSTGGAHQSVRGSIVTLYPDTEPPRIQIDAADGSNVTLLVDPKTASISKHNRRVTVADLSGGDAVDVSFVEKDGSRWLQSLDVVKAYTPPPAPAVSVPAAESVTAPESSAVTMPPTDAPAEAPAAATTAPADAPAATTSTAPDFYHY